MLAKQYGLRGRNISDMPDAALHPFHRPDAHERRRHRRQADTQGRRRRGTGVRRRPLSRRRSRTRSRRSHFRAGRRWSSPTTTRVLGVIHLKDIVKGGLKDRFERFRAMGIKTVMITGDNRAHGRRHSAGGRRGRFPRRGQARGQAAPDPQGAGGRAPGRHDRATGPTTRRPWPRRTWAWP